MIGTIMSRRKKPVYAISSVAELYRIHPQTLRLYDREGLLRPSRSEGNVRYYTDEDLRRLEVILHLTRELGVNLAGVEVVLNMRQKMDDMGRQLNELIEYIQTRLRDDDRIEIRVRHALIKRPPSKLIKVERD